MSGAWYAGVGGSNPLCPIRKALKAAVEVAFKHFPKPDEQLGIYLIAGLTKWIQGRQS
jgi:hypothetical protein